MECGAACSGCDSNECKTADESSKRQPGPKLSDGKEEWVVAVVVAAVSILVRACQAQPNQLLCHAFCRQGTATSIMQSRQQHVGIVAVSLGPRHCKAGNRERKALPSFSAQFRESPEGCAGSIRAPRNEQTALADDDRLQEHSGSKKLNSIRRVLVMAVDVGRATHVRHVFVGALPATALPGGSTLALIPCLLMFLPSYFILHSASLESRVTAQTHPFRGSAPGKRVCNFRSQDSRHRTQSTRFHHIVAEEFLLCCLCMCITKHLLVLNLLRSDNAGYLPCLKSRYLGTTSQHTGHTASHRLLRPPLTCDKTMAMAFVRCRRHAQVLQVHRSALLMHPSPVRKARNITRPWLDTV